MNEETVIVLASGGLSSTVAAARAARDAQVHLLYVDYGHPAATREWPAVQVIGRAIGAQRVLCVEMPQERQIATACPAAETTAAQPRTDSRHADSLAALRTHAFLGAAFQWSVRLNARAVALGSSQVADELERGVEAGQGMAARRREFFHACEMVLEEIQSSRRVLRIDTPLISISRPDIIRLGMRFEAPLDATWNCLRGGDEPCGRCQGCTVYQHALRAVGDSGRTVASTG